MFKSRVNDAFDFELNPDDLATLDISSSGNKGQYFHVLKNGKSYKAELLEFDTQTKSFQIKINDITYSVKLEDQYDQLINRLGLSSLNKKKVNDVKAPMPGLVLKIIVKEGDSVSKGDSLLILEAMKMENVLKADGDGIIKAIRVEEGKAVDKSQVLIEMA